MPSSLDRQTSNFERDAFGHRHFADALRSLIESETHSPPFSIGLLGGWGTGKSTIKELYIRDLGNDARRSHSGHTRSERFHGITFNAWRFGGKDQDIKRALLRQVFLELGGNEEKLQDRLFRQITESHEDPKGFLQYTWDIIKAWAMPIPAFVLSLALLLGLLWLVLFAFPLQDDFSKSIVITALIGAYSYLLKQVKPPAVSAYRPVTRIALPSTTAEQYEDLLLDQIDQFKLGKSKTPEGKSGINCERLIVFVDDLDRLSAEEMVLGLDAVRTFMEIPETQLPNGLGLVFVISCDEAKVADALAKGRKQGDMPGTVFSQTDARRYLDRIFQFRLEIPPFPRNDMRRYAIKQLRELTGIESDLQSRSVSIESLVDRMIHVGVHDPRNALQIVNAFAQAWWLAKKRETEEIGTEKPGGLHEGAVTMHPISLGALSAIKVNFPDFYRDLQNDPALLQRMTDVLVREKPLQDQPLSTRQLLTERYLKKRDGDEDMPYEVRTEHRPLRQYLSSLTGLRWPDSLQSLLLFSEDPITRKFGAKATAIYASFVSGDTQGVLEAFGRHIDASTLKQDEGRLLHQMVEELRHETEARRTNASRVIAELVDRFPEDISHLLLGSLCRELGDSSKLRSQLGIKKIGKVLAVAHDDDRRAVASRLIQDVLTTDNDLSFQLETMESPNVEEAILFARSTLALVLPIRRDNGLDTAADAQLLNWLAGRTVRTGGKHHQLAFKEFEQWVSEHEDHLLPALSDQYADLLATELESDAAPDFDVSAAMSKVQNVFSRLWESGEETRPILWKSLTRYVALKQPEASRAAWEEMTKHVTSTSLNTTQITRFLSTLIERLNKEAQNEEWPLEVVESAAQSLLTFIRTRASEIEDTAIQALSDLAILWSQNADTAALSCDIVKELQRANMTDAQSVFDDWAKRILGDLPIDCIKLLASVFPTLEGSTQKNVVAQLNPVISTDNIDEATGQKYEAFVSQIPDNGWGTSTLKNHLDSLLPQIAARHNNPNKYLTRIFPTIAKVLHHASPSPLGQALHNLFAQAKGQPNHYAWLHSWMATRWPKPSTELSPYDPVKIFNDAHNFAISQPNATSKGLLRSLRKMLERELVPSNLRTAVIESACATWSKNPESAIETFEDDYGDLTPGQAADLLDCLDWTNEENQALLSRAWAAVAQSQSTEALHQTTNKILEKGLSGPKSEPDRGLRFWLDALDVKIHDILKSSITQPQINDTHRNRLWQQATHRIEALGSAFFVEVIPRIAVLSSIEETANSMFDDYDRVSAVLGSSDNRTELSQRLMENFHEVATNTVKSHIASWCKRLSGEASLQQLTPETLTDADLSILKNCFGRTSVLRKLEKLMQQ